MGRTRDKRGFVIKYNFEGEDYEHEPKPKKPTSVLKYEGETMRLCPPGMCDFLFQPKFQMIGDNRKLGWATNA